MMDVRYGGLALCSEYGGDRLSRDNIAGSYHAALLARVAARRCHSCCTTHAASRIFIWFGLAWWHGREQLLTPWFIFRAEHVDCCDGGRTSVRAWRI